MNEKSLLYAIFQYIFLIEVGFILMFGVSLYKISTSIKVNGY